jgi:hypothetical protein
MKIIQQLLLVAAFVIVPNLALADNHELAREPHGIDTPTPEFSATTGAAHAEDHHLHGQDNCHARSRHANR